MSPVLWLAILEYHHHHHHHHHLSRSCHCWQMASTTCAMHFDPGPFSSIDHHHHHHHHLSRSCHCWQMASTTCAMHFDPGPFSSIDCQRLPRCHLSISFWVFLLVVFHPSSTGISCLRKSNLLILIIFRFLETSDPLFFYCSAHFILKNHCKIGFQKIRSSCICFWYCQRQSCCHHSIYHFWNFSYEKKIKRAF